MIWLLLFSQLFESMSSLPGFPTDSYLQFFAPGVVVMTALFGSAWAGMGMIHDMDLGILSKMLATPVTRVSIILSRVIAAVIPLVVQAFIIFTVAWIMGIKIVTGPAGILLSIIMVGLLGLGFAGLSHGLAILFRKAEPVIAIISFLTLPLMFLSTAMMPSQMLPSWITTASDFNPVNYAVDAVRTMVVSGYDWSTIAPGIAFLLIFASLTIGFATTMFRFKRADI